MALRRPITVLMVVAMTLLPAACRDDASVRTAPYVEVSTMHPAPGDVITARVRDPDGRAYSYGLLAVIEVRRADGTWTGTHNVSVGTGDFRATVAPIRTPLAILDIAFTDARPLSVPLPRSLARGTYRIRTDVRIEPRMTRVVAYSDPLTIG